ncbi:S41 family peptidase [Paludicola sp. MB14-C6]|uniref:S41 family peptidase n=1 Tax=Paludihabitans sp. MB14-C6 TaxID=3070656 RepID=UPI0027DC4D41|nr:S41 family peptidase [Paludicola sp. MB14-C6]WMJ23566.1 S41 family peptidase [Paludicola sp. MB14-C6]
MNKKISLGAAIAFMVVLAGITFCITMMVSLNYFNTMVLNVKNREEMYKKIADLDREVRQNFDGTIDEEALLNSISAGYVKGIGDKYSTYLTKEQYEERLKDLSGKSVGIGVTVAKDDSGYLLIKKVLAESPAKIANLEVGDYIVSINDTDLKTLSYDNAVRLIKGDAGSKLKLVYRRNGVDTPIDIIRKDITIPYVEMQILDKNAVIKITDFNEKTPSQFIDAVNKAIKGGATGLIFDLRDNGGGTVNSVIEMLDFLLPNGDLGYKIDNTGKKTVLGTSDKHQISMPMVALVNSKTASASELFVSTLRDINKTSIVGVNTYGKGVMQSLIKLTDGSAINVTTAHFFPPSGQKINGVGIKPEYEVKLKPELETNLISIKPEQDTQLQKALEVLNSKKAK